jgi:hypothetical protein
MGCADAQSAKLQNPTTSADARNLPTAFPHILWYCTYHRMCNRNKSKLV